MHLRMRISWFLGWDRDRERYERKMGGDERKMKESNKSLKGKSRKMQADERIVRNFPPGEIK